MSKTKIIKLKLFELVQDFSVYPRKSTDAYYIASLVAAVRAGIKLPPIIICAATKRIVDGFHRFCAYKSVFGEDCEVECEEREYATEQELFQDAADENRTHGLRLSNRDKLWISEKLRGYGVQPSKIAQTLGWSSVKLELMRERIVRPPGEKATTIPQSPQEMNVLNHRLKPYLNGGITKEQIQVNNSWPQISPIVMLDSLSAFIGAGFDWKKNERFVNSARRLSKVMGKEKFLT